MSKTKEFKAPQYLITKDFLLEDENLSLPEMIIYTYIYELYHSTGLINASTWYLGKLIKVKGRQAQRVLESLITKGYIRRDDISETERTFTPLVFPKPNPLKNKDPELSTEVRHIRRTPPVISDAPPPSDVTHNNITNKIAINKTGSGFSKQDKEALALLRSKLNDKRISVQQMRDVMKFHTSKEATLAWSLDNYLLHLTTQTEVIKNKVVVLADRLQKYGYGYYPDMVRHTEETKVKEMSAFEARSAPNHPSHSKARFSSLRY